MDLWRKASTSKVSDISLTLQSLLFELHSGQAATDLNPEDVKLALQKTMSHCGNEPKLQIQWCRLAVLALNAVQCTFTCVELNEMVSFTARVCQHTNYMYCTVDALGAILYDTDLNAVDMLYELLGEGGLVLQLCLGQAPEREVQHLALRCLNNMLNSVTDEVFVTHIVSVLVSLATVHLHGDNLNRARLLAGAMKCLQTISKHSRSQYILEQILATVKGCIVEEGTISSALSSPAISLDSLSLDEVALSDNFEQQSKHSQPRVRNKRGKTKKKRPEVGREPLARAGPQRGAVGTPPSTSSPMSLRGGIHQGSERLGSWRQEPPKQAKKKEGVEKQVTPAAPSELNKDMAFNSRQTDFSISASESEHSESDSEEGLHNKVMSVKCRTRLATFLTLQNCISSVHKSQMYSVWAAFLPPDMNSGLLHAIQKEQNVKCRIAALGALTMLVESAKHYFVAADARPKGTGKVPFTPFSQTLATDLVTLHTELVIIVTGCQPGVLPHLLQCLAVLVLHTPFSKLQPGLISQILNECCKHLDKESLFKTQAGALNLLCAALTVETPLSEVECWLQNNPTIVELCLEHLKQLKHQKDILQILCQLLRFYFKPILPWWYKISCAAKFSFFGNADTLLQNMSLLVLEELGRALSSQLEQQTPGLDVITLKEYWVEILHSVVVRILQEENSVVMPGACDILSTIGNQVFSSFEVHTQRLIMTQLLALTNPTVPATSSACRCLGVLVMYPCIRDDLLFVADTANAIITALETTDTSDSGLLLRVSWSLGNLSDTLVVNKLNNPTFVSDFSDLLLGRLLDVSLKTATSNDKVKSNVVRALGNFLRFMKQSTYEKAHFKDYVARSVECLLKSCAAGMMKTRWNACYALVNTLQNPILSPSHAPWGSDLFNTLLSVITHCKNFKVRINATLALTQCATRASYGAQFGKLYSTVLIMLCDEVAPSSGGGQMSGYTEKLRLQLLLLLCHLIELHEEEDIHVMSKALPPQHLHAGLIARCSAVSSLHTLTDAERATVERARDIAQRVPLRVVQAMLAPKTLPSDTEAFETSDLTQNTAPVAATHKNPWNVQNL